jgi:hypothetical protein
MPSNFGNIMTIHPCGCWEVFMPRGRAFVPCNYHEARFSDILEKERCRCHESPTFGPLDKYGVITVVRPPCPVHVAVQA